MTNLKVNCISQVRQISDELIQHNNYHINLTKLVHEQTEQSEPIKIPETAIESTDKEVENQAKKLKREENITYTTENIYKKKKIQQKNMEET